MGYKYSVYYSRCQCAVWDGIEGFETFNEAVRFARKIMKKGYNLIDIKCRDVFKNGINIYVGE